MIGILLPQNLARNPQGRDFVQDWSSARNYFQARPIYSDLAETLPEYLGQRGPLYFQVNAHPPASVLVTLPLGKLPFTSAFLVWQLASFVSLLVALWLVVREPDLGYSRWAFWGVLALLLWSNVLTELAFHGPLNAVLFLLIVGSWSAQRRGKLLVAGGLIGAAAALKLFPAFLMLFFLAKREYRAVLASVFVFLFANVLTAAVLGFDAYLQYYFEVVPRVAVFRDYWMNASITGWFSKLFDSPNPQVTPLIESPQIAKLGIAVCSLAVVAAIARFTWSTEQPAERDHAFSLAILGMLLVSPVTWNHYFLFAVLPLMIWWIRCKARPERVVLGLTFVFLITLSPAWAWRRLLESNVVEVVFFPGQVQAVATPWQTLLPLSLQFYALVVLFVWGLVAWRKLVALPQLQDGQPTPEWHNR